MTGIGVGPGWVPQACTLPTAERPLRLAEFDAVFATAVRGVARVSPTELRLTLDGGTAVEATVRDLTARESECCSFFEFALVRDHAALVLTVGVPVVHVEVLDAVAERATSVMPGAVG